METGFAPNPIGGRVEADGWGRFENENSATNETSDTAARSAPRDVEAEVAAARNALPGWRRTPAPRRGEILFRAAEALRRQTEDLALLMTAERGKVLAEARGDVQEGRDMTYYMAREGRRLLGQTLPSERPDKFAKAVREAVGVVVHLPFGGTEAAGNGHREAGTAALDVYSEWETIYIDYSGRLPRARMDMDPALWAAAGMGGMGVTSGTAAARPREMDGGAGAWDAAGRTL